MAKPLPLPPPLPRWFAVAGGGISFDPPPDALVDVEVLLADAVDDGFDAEVGELDKGVPVSLVESLGVFDVLALCAGVEVLLSLLLALLPRRRERLFFAPFGGGVVELGVIAASPPLLSEAGGVLVDAAVSVVAALSLEASTDVFCTSS